MLFDYLLFYLRCCRVCVRQCKCLFVTSTSFDVLYQSLC
ncbi:Uncharacterised protein [Vibrio cholerae]|nr:Uncharacterised protein [Vibrio cholerae]